MTKIDFYKLPRAVQDGLIDAFRGQFTPVPILARPGTRPTALIWAAVSGAAALALAVLMAVGFGEVESALALHPAPAVAAYVLLATASALGAIQALARRSSVRALPFEPGVYLFPANVIDARDHDLGVHPLAKLSSVSAGPGGAVVVRFGETPFSFPVAEPSRTAELVQQVEAARDRMRAGPEPAELRRLDPLEPPVVESPLGSTIPLSRGAARWGRSAWFLAAAIGAASGAGLFYLRNLTSDGRMFTLATRRDDVASYKRYLAQGRDHVDEVSQVRLPRAELRLAVAQGSVEAVDAFMRAYPKTGIATEVEAARRAALAAEFERARKADTLAALLSFAERYPDHGVGKEFDQAKHALYARAHTRYKSEVPKGGEQNAELVGRLLAHAERVGAKTTPRGLRGPTVQIRFRRLPSHEWTRAEEQLVMKSPTFAGVTSFPTRYIDAAGLEPHEQSAAQALAEAFARAFEPEIMTFEPGPLLEGSGDERPAVTSPTLAVSYRVDPSGAAQSRTKPRGIYLGLALAFSADFLLPGDAHPPSVKMRLVQRIPVEILKQQPDAPAPGTVEAAIYAAMIKEAFTEFQGRYLAKWFRPRKEAK